MTLQIRSHSFTSYRYKNMDMFFFFLLFFLKVTGRATIKSTQSPRICKF